ncbi:MAG: hypothetical protein GC168_09300 [Candidatus Hydrogenedens sp.]|nr:hypothetical protein [Candidatus Hydrogenedens sp.]
MANLLPHSWRTGQGLLAAVCLAAGVLAPVAARAQAVPLETELWGEASLYRDEWGVPHVYAKTPRGLGFAFGYAQAEDHVEPMLLAYRAATGRLAEVQGEAAAEIDRYALRVGHKEIAAEALPLLDEVTQALCEGFALGVNAWLAEHIDAAPDWAEGVEPVEVLALWHAYLMSYAPLDLPDAFRRRPAAPTGNAWAVGPGQTPEGQTVLVVNPHQYYDGPFQWYEAHLALDDYNVMGATLYGLPVILMGHNGVLGWGLTPNEADTADVFDVSAAGEAAGNPADPRIFEESLLGNEEALLLEYYSQAQSYFVRTASGLEERFEPVHLEATGPIIESGGQLYHWRIGGYRAMAGFRQLLDMGRAGSLEAFQDALMLRQLPCFHVVYGDALGNVFYLYNAIAGVRGMPDGPGTASLNDAQLAWKAPLPGVFENWGWRTEYDVPEMPYIVNPASGFVQACGTPPWTATDDPPFYPEMWDYALFGDAESGRAYRIRTLLRSGLRSFRDNQSLLFDVVAPAAQSAASALLQIAQSQPGWVENAHPDLAGLLEVLGQWDSVAETRAQGMTAFHMWWSLFRTRMPDYGSDSALSMMLQSGDPDTQSIALETAEEAARMMRNEFDSVTVPWGDVHRLRRGDKDWPMPGAVSGSPVFVSGDATYDKRKWIADYGYGYALAVQFGDKPNAVSLVPFGASDNPDSPHFDDQTELLLSRRMKRTRYAEDDVQRNATFAKGRDIVLYPRGVEAAFRIECTEPMRAALSTKIDPPGFLRDGDTGFSLYVEVQCERPEVSDARASFSFYVPPDLCAPEFLSMLRVAHYDATAGWTDASLTSRSADGRTLAGEGPVGGFYAVLGPKQAMAPLPDGEAASKPAPPAPAPAAPAVSEPSAAAPLAPPEPALNPKAEEETTFKFNWKNDPHSLGQGGNVVAPGGGTGERKFKMEMQNAPEKSTEEPPAPEAVQRAMQPGDGPTGQRTFKIERQGGKQEAQPQENDAGGGKVVYGLPPHVLERQKKLREQQQQETKP